MMLQLVPHQTAKGLHSLLLKILLKQMIDKNHLDLGFNLKKKVKQKFPKKLLLLKIFISLY
jgi:hypothetical protein